MFRWLILFSCSLCYTAGPLMHLYLAERWCDAHGIQEREAFFKGSTFPDIRYVAHVPREQTHVTGVTCEHILLCESPFEAGYLHHCYVDEWREKLVVEHAMYALIQDVSFGHEATLLKLVEDEILFDRWQSYHCLYANVSEEELITGIEGLDTWNWYLSWYLYLRPSLAVGWIGWYGKPLFSVPPEVLLLWGEIIPRLAAMEEMQEHVARIVAFFDFDK